MDKKRTPRIQQNFRGVMMDDVKQALIRTEIELGEWKETLGTRFPSFLNGVLMARLMKAEAEIEYLRKIDACR